MRPRRELSPTAIHEAGHAVIGRVLTLACGGASIAKDSDSAGHAIVAEPNHIIREWERRGKERSGSAVWYGRIIAYMAGAEAEITILGSAQCGDGDDRRQIDLMLEEVAGDDQYQRVEARLRQMTRTLVRRHRDRIERVADALIKNGKLTAQQIDKLCGRSVDDVTANAPFLLALGRLSSG